MKIKDKNLKVYVDVYDAKCLKRDCYWPRPDPGIFNIGQGYKARSVSKKNEYLCGTREIKGCPDDV